MPSKEQESSSVLSLRLSDSLLDRLDRYLDWMEVHQHEKISRNHAMRLALTQWLDDQEAQGAMTHPDVLRQRFHAAYTSLRSGQDRVDIHRLRRLLNWTTDRFDALLEQLRAESHVVLHLGDASCLNDEERQHSYDVNGQLYLTLSWQD
jgi:hypothetical protein